MKRFYVLLVALLITLTGCGGGGGGNSSQSTPLTVSGVAATGAPLAGTVYLKDSSAPAKELSTTIAADGSFSFDVTSLTAPYLIKAVGTSGGKNYTLYSFAADHGTANVNPFTHLSAVRAYGNDNLSALYTSPDPAAMLAIKQKIASAITEIQTLMTNIFAQYGVTTVNFISDKYSANHQGLDLLFDMISIDASGGVVTIKNKSNNTVIYTSQSNNVLSGQINVNNVPAPPVQIAISVLITPNAASVVANNKVNFAATVIGTTNQLVSWGVVEANGGSITSAGVYTAPAAPGTYHVKATSVADNTKSVTSAVAVTSAVVNTGIQIWKSDSSVSPAVTFTIGSKLGENNLNTIAYYSGSIQSSFFGNGIVNVTSINTASYFYSLPDNSWLIFAGDPTDVAGNKWVMIGTNAITSTSTKINGSVSIFNGFTPVFSGNATFTKQ